MRRIQLAIIAALDDEIKNIVSKVAVDERVHVRPALFWRGMYGGRQILLGRSGLGLEAMDSAIRYCLANFHPALCLHVGYCGGADPALAPGDLVIATSVTDARTERRIAAEPELVQRAQEIISRKGMRGRTGGIATVNEIISSPHEKAFVGTKFNAVALDMESSSFAAACAHAQTPYLIVRAVLDPLSETLPDLSDALDSSGHADGLAFADHIIRHPGDALKLPRLEYLAAQARIAITDFIDAWIAEAPQ